VRAYFEAAPVNPRLFFFPDTYIAMADQQPPLVTNTRMISKQDEIAIESGMASTAEVEERKEVKRLEGENQASEKPVEEVAAVAPSLAARPPAATHSDDSTDGDPDPNESPSTTDNHSFSNKPATTDNASATHSLAMTADPTTTYGAPMLRDASTTDNTFTGPDPASAATQGKRTTRLNKTKRMQKRKKYAFDLMKALGIVGEYRSPK
jgi:hypothetical protein